MSKLAKHFKMILELVVSHESDCTICVLPHMQDEAAARAAFINVCACSTLSARISPLDRCGILTEEVPLLSMLLRLDMSIVREILNREELPAAETSGQPSFFLSSIDVPIESQIVEASEEAQQSSAAI